MLRGLVDGIERFQHARLGRRDEKDQRHHQVRGVERFAAEVLHEGLTLLAPALRHDLLVDPVARFRPAIAIGRERALVGETQCAVERDPGHQLGVDEMLLAAAHLPDPVVLALPVVAHPVDDVL